MLWNYVRFDFGKNYFRDVSVLQLIEKKWPVSMSLGIWMTLLTYLISIPLGILKAVDDGSRFDMRRSSVIIVGYAIPGFLFAILLIILFAGGSFFDGFPVARAGVGKLVTAMWQQIRRLFLAPHAAHYFDGAVGFPHHDVTNARTRSWKFPQTIVLTARAKGCTAIRCFTATFSATRCDRDRRLSFGIHSCVFHRLAADRDHFLARRPWAARLRKRSQSRLSGGLRYALYFLADWRGGEPDFDLTYTWIDPRIDFETREV